MRHLEALRDVAKGERVYVVGNGPSLSRQSPAILSGHHVIACNLAGLWCGNHPEAVIQLATDAAALLLREPCIDNRRRVEWMAEYAAPIFVSTQRVTREWRTVVEQAGCFVMPARWAPNGSRSATPSRLWLRFPEIPTYAGWTCVVTAIDVARYMGAREIVLLGVDMDYSDLAHFFPGSRGASQQWDYERHTRPVMERLAKMLHTAGVDLLNGTDGGRLDCIPRVTLGGLH